MATEEHTAIARRFEVEHPTEHAAAVADELLAPTVAIHAPAVQKVCIQKARVQRRLSNQWR